MGRRRARRLSSEQGKAPDSADEPQIREDQSQPPHWKNSWGKIGVNSPGDATAYGVGTLVELLDEGWHRETSFCARWQVTNSGGQDSQMSMFGGGPQATASSV